MFHLGDLVSYGYDEDEWVFIDGFLDKLGNLGISFYPTLGNHELLNLPKTGEANFLKRFPEYIKTGYTKIIGSTAIILLNSNFEYLSEVLIKKQVEWFTAELIRLDKDKSIDNIIVGCHHTPYTNSSMVSSSVDVQEHFVSLFSAFKKCRLFLSGHAHRIEHFIINNQHLFIL